jgi:hypothetical protein
LKPNFSQEYSKIMPATGTHFYVFTNRAGFFGQKEKMASSSSFFVQGTSPGSSPVGQRLDRTWTGCRSPGRCHVTVRAENQSVKIYFTLEFIRNFAIRNFASKITFVFRESFILFRRNFATVFENFEK